MLPLENFIYADKFCIPHLQSDPSVNVGVHQDDPEKREEILMGGLGSLQGPEEGRDYIVCCRAYTAISQISGYLAIRLFGCVRQT